MSLNDHKIQPGDIIIKNIDVLKGLMERSYSPLLIIIICSVSKEFGFVMTESYRKKRHRNDLHGTLPVRANDLRFWCYETEQKAYEIMRWINNRWIYDPKRPEMLVAKIHKTKKGVLHFHIQVHPNTIYRNYQ